MARRFDVSAAEVDAAIDDLAARHLLRRLPDGQVYRASPAEYRVPLEGLSGLTSHVDPMGGQLVCKSRQVSRRRPPEDIGRSLGLEAGEPVLVIRCVWTVGGEPGALSASYLPERLGQLWPDLGAPPFAPLGDYPPVDGLPAAGLASGEAAGPAAGEPRGGVPAAAGGADAPSPGAGAAGEGAAPAVTARPRALQLELAPPPSSVARSLRLAAGELVATVTVSFEDPAGHRPVAITTAMLRPDLFRIVIEAAPDARADGSASVWTHAATGWEP
jgi:UTRA domain